MSKGNGNAPAFHVPGMPFRDTGTQEHFRSCSVKIHPKCHSPFPVPRSLIRRPGNFSDNGHEHLLRRWRTIINGRILISIPWKWSHGIQVKSITNMKLLSQMWAHAYHKRTNHLTLVYFGKKIAAYDVNKPTRLLITWIKVRRITISLLRGAE